MSSFIYPGDTKVKVNSFTTPRQLYFTGSGVSVAEDSSNNRFTITITSGSGEANTTSNSGTGEGTLALAKSGVNLPFKTIKAGTNITVTNNATDVTISAAGSVGEANTASNVGTAGVGVYKQKTGIDIELKKINAGSSKVIITDDVANSEIDVDVAEANLNLANIGGTLSDASLSANVITTTNTKTMTNKTLTSPVISTISNTGTLTLPTSTDTLIGRATTDTITNKTVDFKDNTVLNSGLYLFTVFKSGTTYYLRNNETGVIVTSNTNPTTVLQAAIDNCSSNSASACLIKRGTYLLTAQLVGIDKNFRLHGEGMLLTGNTGITNSDTILKANYTGAAGEALIDCTNTVYNRQQFSNLVIDCNNTVDIGLKAIDVRERYPWLSNVAVLNASSTGIYAGKLVYTTTFNVVIAACTNYGLRLVSGVGNANTFYMYGGRMTSNGTNLLIDESADVGFEKVVFESGTTNCIKTSANAAKQIRYRDCSFEWHPVTTTNIACDDSGVNITYDNCRFDSNNTTYYPITVRAAARQVSFINCKFQANNLSTTANITVESGAQDTWFIGNQQDTNTPLTISLSDSGTRTVVLGNSSGFGDNKITFNSDSITLKHSTTNNAGDILKNSGTKFDRLARGSANNILRVNSGGTDVEWGAVPDAALSSNVPLINTANVFTAVQKVNINSASPLTLYKPINTAFTQWGLDFNANDSTSAEATYAKIFTSLEDNTSTSKDSYIGFQYHIGNTIARRAFMGGNTIGTGPSGTQFIISNSGLTGDRTYTGPDASGKLLCETTTQTITTKTINLTDNTVTDTSTAAGDLAKSNGTKFSRFARGTLYGQTVRVNKTQTDIEYARQAVFPSSNLFGTQGRRWGTWFLGTGTTGAGIGLLNSITVNGSNPAFATFTAADGSRPARFTPAASTGATNGYATGSVTTCRQWSPRFKCRFRLNNKADTRFFIGFNNTGGIFTTDDPLNTKAGIAFGKIDDAVNTNFVIMHNDGVGAAATVLDTVAAADNSIHQIEIVADDTNSKWSWSFDNGAFTDVTTEVPGSGTAIGFAWNCETTNTTQPTFDIFWVEIESD